MIFVDSQHPPGTIGIVRGELARYTDFEDSLDALHVPRGTAIVRLKGPSVARNRNAVVEQMRGSWVAFFDDDHVVPRDTVLKLLSHEQPIVGALYSAKRPPFYPTCFQARRADGLYIPHGWRGLAALPRLVPCVATGTGGMLIRRDVFRAIPAPWFHWGEYSDDIYFCEKARQYGFPIHLDRAAPLGHTSTYNVWPVGEGVHIQIDDVRLALEDDADRAAGDTGAGDPT